METPHVGMLKIASRYGEMLDFIVLAPLEIESAKAKGVFM